MNAPPRPPLWKRLASYLVSFVVERHTTPHNPVVEVVYSCGRYVLNGRSVNYSFGGLHQVFVASLGHLGVPVRPIRRVLVLGLGAGSIPAILSGYGKPYEVTGVEADPLVLDLAARYWGLHQLPNIQLDVVNMLAEDFVAEDTLTYDLICVDLFVDNMVPAAAQTPIFLHHLHRLMAPGALLMYNCMFDRPEEQAQARNFAALFEAVFPGTRELTTQVNLVLVAEKQLG